MADEGNIDFGKAWIRFEPPNTLRISTKANEQLDPETSQRIRAYGLEQTGGKPYKALLVPEPGANVTPEMREYLANSDRATQVIADAMVISNFPHRLLADFYLRFNHPTLPTRLFSTEEAARAWLDTLD